MSLKKVLNCVKRKNNFLITTHIRLEGDALGSELAFYSLLKSMNKRARIINDDELPPEYGFLPDNNAIEKLNRKSKNLKFDCFVILDCSTLERCGEVYKLNTQGKPMVNIDHHISNEKFGDINWIEPHFASCTEMIYKIYKALKIPLDKKIATYLYAGMLTDTGSFRYTNTTSSTHKIASELLKFNLDIPHIYKSVYENIPFDDMKLLTKILQGIRRESQGRIIWFQVKQGLLRNKKISFDLSEQILNFARAIKDSEVAVLFKENLGVKNEIRVNFRSHGKVDVNRIARIFGGGGHRTASGATIKGSLDQVRRKVLTKIKESLV
jgi:phosphoesterase RecJ-like protein